MTATRRRSSAARASGRAAAVALLFGICGTGHAQWLQTLRDQALARDPGVAAAKATARGALERLAQAEGALGPTAALVLNKSETRYNEAPNFDLRRFNGKQAALQINQPLWKAALWFGKESAQAQWEQTESQVVQARDEATLRLLESCFDVLKARDVVVLLGAQGLAAEEQLVSARRSLAVGTANIVDVREAEAKIDTVKAQALAARADLDLKQELLAEFVGAPVPEMLDKGLSGQRLPALEPAGVLQWLAAAQTRNVQIQAARRGLEAAEAEVRKAWQGHAPTADLSYAYTISSDTGTVTSIFPRRGDTSQVTVNVNVPLFASGATQARVRETLAQKDKAQADLDAALRAVQINVRQSFTAGLSAIGLTRGLETATRSLEAALQANRRAYEVGMKVNAEVLEAQSKLYEARKDLSRARYDAWLNLLRLKALSQQLEDIDLAELDRLLQDGPPALPSQGKSRAAAMSRPVTPEDLPPPHHAGT
jgi:outer membrane protein